MTALVTDNLPLVSCAPNGMAKLRELILDLASRGKLAEQIGNSEPASKLVSRLKEYKADVARQGGFRTSKAGIPVDLGCVPFNIPEDWCWARWNDIALKIGDIDHQMPESDPNGVPFVSPRDFLPGNVIDFDGAKRVSRADFERLSAKIRAERGDLVYPRYGTIGENVLVEVDREFLVSYSCAVIKVANGFIDPDFQFYVSLSHCIRNQAKSAENKTTQANVGIKSIQEFLFPVPPLEEQHRIVAKVDELMALCDRLEAEQADAEAAHAKLVEALLACLTQGRYAADFRASWQQLAEHFHTLFTTEASIDALKQTVVHLAVMGKLIAPAEGEASASDFLAEIEAARAEYEATPGLRTRQRADQGEPMAPPPYPAPAGWEWRNLGSLLLITGGVTLGRKLAGRELVSLPYLRVANVQRGFLVLDQVKEIEVPADEVAKYALAPGDLLTTEGGDWDKVGRTAIWQGEIAKCLHQNHVFRSRPYTDTFSSRWVELYLNSPPARDYFAGSSKQTTNLASINMTQLRACAFPVPPFAEQQRIVAVVDDLLERCDQLRISVALAMQQHEHLASVLVAQAVA